MFRHVVMFRWSDQATTDARATALEELSSLPERIPWIRGFSFGNDAGLADGNHDLVVVADFDDADDYQRYASDPAHLQLVANHLGPLISERGAVQYQLD